MRTVPSVDDGSSSSRIKALDGLRALAVAAVVVYHLGLSWGGQRVLSGGFLGVDLFFVLSGYLITSLVMKEIDRSSTVGLSNFWARRFRRLMPASLVLILAVSLWGMVVGWGRDIDSDVLASVFWVQNWHLIVSQEPYVARFSAPSPLTHFWSLSIEEQWYLIFPIVALLGRKVIRRRPTSAAIAAFLAALMSAVVMALTFTEGSSRAYFGTDSRLSALLIGCAFAFLPATGSPSRMRRSTSIVLLLTGLATWTLLVLVAEDTDSWMYPWGFVLVALGSACAVIGASRSQVSWFDSIPVQWLGTRSYGVYLWHWPVFVALNAERTGLDGFGLVAIRLAATALLVELSFRLIERPIRTGRFQRVSARNAILIGLTASMVVAFAVVLAPIDTPSGGSVEVLADAAEAADRSDGSTPVANAANELGVLVVGDSVAFGLGFGTDAFDAAGSPVRLLNGALPGCGLTRLARPDSTYLVGDVLDRCIQLGDEWAQQLRKGTPDAVVYIVGPYDNLDVLEGDERLTAGSAEWSEAISRRLNESFDILTSTGLPVIAVVPACRSVEPAVSGLSELTAELVDELVSIVQDVASQRSGDVVVRDPSSWQCDAEGQPVPLADGTAIRDDGVHYTETGKTSFWEWMVPIVEEVVGAPDGAVVPTTDPPGEATTTTVGPSPSTTILIIGDAVAGSLARGAREAARSDGVDLVDYYFPGCTLIGGDLVRPDGTLAQAAAQCAPIRDGLSVAAKSAQPDIVVLLLGNYEVYDRRVNGRTLPVGSAEYEAFLAAELSRAVDDSGGGTIPVVVLTPPCLLPSNPAAPIVEPGIYAPDRLTWLADAFSRFASNRPFETVGLDLQEAVCPGGVHREQVDNVDLYVDGTRFTTEGAELVWDWLLPQIKALVPS